MPEYISVKEFAEIVGVTPSAVYQRIEKDLKPYSALGDDGNKMLDKEALKLYKKSKDKDLQLDKTLDDLKQIERISRFYDQDSYIGDLRSQIEYLTSQVMNLEGELSKEREHGRSQSDTIADLALRFSDISKSSQVLLGVEQQNRKKRGWLRLFSKPERGKT